MITIHYRGYYIIKNLQFLISIKLQYSNYSYYKGCRPAKRAVPFSEKILARVAVEICRQASTKRSRGQTGITADVALLCLPTICRRLISPVVNESIPITVAEQSKAFTVSVYSKLGSWVRIPLESCMSVCVYSVSVVLYR
jgi:hypothetical protein